MEYWRCVFIFHHFIDDGSHTKKNDVGGTLPKHPDEKAKETEKAKANENEKEKEKEKEREAVREKDRAKAELTNIKG